MEKASVLPLPVFPRPSTSRPARVSGSVCDLDGEGVGEAVGGQAATSAAGTPRSAKVAVLGVPVVGVPVIGVPVIGVVMRNGAFQACVARLPVGNIGSPRDMECSALKSQALESIESAIRALKREDGAGWSESVPRRAVAPGGVSVATTVTGGVLGVAGAGRSALIGEPRRVVFPASERLGATPGATRERLWGDSRATRQRPGEAAGTVPDGLGPQRLGPQRLGAPTATRDSRSQSLRGGKNAWVSGADRGANGHRRNRTIAIGRVVRAGGPAAVQKLLALLTNCSRSSGIRTGVVTL